MDTEASTGAEASARHEMGGDAAAKKTSPQEAFDALRNSIEEIRREVACLRDSNESLTNSLSETLKTECDSAIKPVLESLYELHDILFQRVTAMESGKEEPDGFIVNLLESLEGELDRHNISVIRAQPGDKLNREVMYFTGSVKCPWWREADRVARVNRCGFSREVDGKHEVIRKAAIDVYRRM